MKYLSEILNKAFDSVEELENAEKEYEKQKAEKEALKAERKRRADEVNEAWNDYNAKLKKFIEDYGTYHRTYTKDNSPLYINSFLNSFFNL